MTAHFIVKYKLRTFYHDACIVGLCASGFCSKSNVIIIPDKQAMVIDTKETVGSRFGCGFIFHEVMEGRGFKWGQEKPYSSETWHSPSGRKIKGIYLM